MKLPFGIIQERPSGVAEITFRKNTCIGTSESATLPEAVFTKDSGHNISKNSRKIGELLLHKKLTLIDAKKIIDSYHKENDFFPSASLLIEATLIDTLLKSINISAAELFDIPESYQEVPFGKSFGVESRQKLIENVTNTINAGAKKIKLKINPDNFQKIYQSIIDLKKRFPHIEIMVDANGTFDPENNDHINMLNRIDSLELIMIEEPVSRVGRNGGIEAVKILRKKTNLKTPVCLDDCLIDKNVTLNSIKEDLADIVNIKPGRIGSIIDSLEIANYCKKNSKQVMIGGMLEATPGRTINTVLAAHLHTNLKFTIPGDLSLAQERLENDIVPINRQLKIGNNGGIVLPRNPGWGC